MVLRKQRLNSEHVLYAFGYEYIILLRNHTHILVAGQAGSLIKVGVAKSKEKRKSGRGSK